MKLSGATWSFVGTTLSESVAIYRALGVSSIDLIAAPGAGLDSRKLIEHPDREALLINELNVPIANLIFLSGSNFADRALNHCDPHVRLQNINDFHAVVEFCRLCSIPSVTVLPGVRQRGWLREKSVSVSGDVLNEISRIAREKGILLTFEAHVGSILESPRNTLTFLENNPSLKLTLDYSHFIFNGYRQEEVDPLIPYAGHVHLRQGAKHVLQARWDKGIIDFSKIVRDLRTAKYDGYLALEYEHDSWLKMDRVDVMTETVKMRNLVRPLLW